MDNLYSSFYLCREHKKLTFRKAAIAYIQYKDFRVDLITAKKSFLGIESFLEDLDKFKTDQEFENPLVIHLFYELGYLSTEQVELLPTSLPLAIFIQYEQASIEDIFSYELSDDFRLEPLSVFDKVEYLQKFEKIQEHLKQGDCYQINYTLPFYLRANKKVDPKIFIDLVMANSSKVGAFAHGTYIDSLGKLFLSNSPECLFQIKKNNDKSIIQTMPIKGTYKVSPGESKEFAWDKLSKSKKDESELNMITDLMRNDLSKLTKNISTVHSKKIPLYVPGIVHQYSVVESTILHELTLKDLVLNLFPGGSITGAPKKRVMKIISELENNPRGVYCGSTIMAHKSHLSASRNIRSSEIDYINKEIFYGAGGGITINSSAEGEYEEALLKLKSFLLTFI